MSTERVINLYPFHLENSGAMEGFVLKFWCDTEGDKRIILKLHFESWWPKFIARSLWEVIKRMQAQIDDGKNAMEGK